MNEYSRKQHAKLTQVIQNFFIKTVQVVNQARVFGPLDLESSTGHDDQKINKWFNLCLSFSEDAFKEDLRMWKQASSLHDVPPMIVETYLDISSLGPRQTLILFDADGRTPVTVAKGASKKHEVVLERWLVEFDRDILLGSVVDEVPFIYKQAIILIRNIYTLVRLMPAYKLARKLAKLNGSSSTLLLLLGVRVADGSQTISLKGRVGLLKPILQLHQFPEQTHLVQREFEPICTTLGTLKVSVAYRIHHNFEVHNLEEVLLSHFLMDDDHQHQHHQHQHDSAPVVADNTTDKRISVTSMSVSPCLSLKDQLQLQLQLVQGPGSGHAAHHLQHLQGSQHLLLPQPVSRPSIQPFKVGSISNSPPPHALLERRFLITSNKLTLNASLVAMLRNQRNSASSSNTLNIPISTTVATTPTVTTSFPRSVLSLHPDETLLPYGAQDFSRFLSLFGSRALRRYLSTSMNRQSTLLHQGSVGLVGLMSLEAPSNGIYIDDDISDFVKMIDSKNDLHFLYSSQNHHHDDSGSHGGLGGGQADSLVRFQQLRSQHQQLGESVGNLVLLHSGIVGTPGTRPVAMNNDSQYQSYLVGRRLSRSRSRGLVNSQTSPPALLGSYDNHVPLIHSRLREEARSRSLHPLEGPFVGTSSTGATPSTPVAPGAGVNTTTAKAASTTVPEGSAQRLYGNNNLFLRLLLLPPPGSTKQEGHVSKKEIAYENVFEDEDDDDDLLFTMSDMNLNK